MRNSKYFSHFTFGLIGTVQEVSFSTFIIQMFMKNYNSKYKCSGFYIFIFLALYMYELNTNCITCKFGGFQITISTQFLKLTHLSDLITRHFSKGGLQLLSDGLVLLLLSCKFILQSVNLNLILILLEIESKKVEVFYLSLEFLNRFLCKFCPSLSLL